MFSFFRRRKAEAVKSTPLSKFVRSPSSKKKQVYVTALKRASAAQNKVIERSAGRGRASDRHPTTR